MNKAYGIVLMSLISMSISMQADQEYKLDQITAAIKDSDLARVKKQWRRIDSTIESSEDKKAMLRVLVDTAAQVADESKMRPVVGEKDYKKIVGGMLTIAGGTGAAAYYMPLHRMFYGTTQNEQIKGWAIFMGLAAISIAGGRLARNGMGWDTAQDLIANRGHSKASAILAYLEDQLHDILNENITLRK